MIYLNGEQHAGAETVTALLMALGRGPDPRGLAVAIDGEVVPRAQWPTQQLRDGMRVEVVGAIQGG